MNNPVKEQAYLHTEKAGAVVPLFQAVITGGLIGLIALVIVIWQRVQDGLIYALLIWLIVTALTWLILQKHWFTLTTIERLTGFDLDGDGYTGEPYQVQAPPAHTVRVDLRTTTTDGHYQARRADLPIDEATMIELATGLLAGKPLTEREWAGTGKPLSCDQVRELKRVFKANGILELVNPSAPKQGDKLTKAGVATMRYFANLSPSPTEEGP